MSVWIRSALLLALCVVPSTAFGQFGDFTYSLDPVVGSPGELVGTVLRLESTAPILAGSAGVCHDSARASISSAVLGPAIASSDFADVDTFTDGVTVAFVLSLVGSATIPAGNHEFLLIEYSLLGPAPSTSPLEVCDTLGGPPVIVSVVVPPQTSVPADVLNSTITVQAVGPPASDPDLDEGEFVLLSPSAAQDPLVGSQVGATNIAAGDDQSVTVSESFGETQPASSGFSVFDRKLEVTATMPDGTFFMQISVPFASTDLAGMDPLLIDLTTYDRVAGSYVLAASLNTAPSPGFTGPVGDRFTESGSAPSALSDDLGDYGVFWNPALGQGFAWANVDHLTEYAAGTSRLMRRGDCNVDGGVDIGDAIAVLNYLFPQGAPTPLACEKSCDANDDGSLDIGDGVRVLTSLFGLPTDPLPAPGVTCGFDPTADLLGCETTDCP